MGTDIQRDEVSRGEVILRARGVKKHFDGIRAVDGMDIDVREGEIVGLIGPNGAGKTTFFNTVTGRIRPDAGTIRFKGEEIQGLPPHQTALRGLVRTFQVTRALTRMTVRENLMLAPQGQIGERVWVPLLPFGARPRMIDQEAGIREQAREMLETIDLDHLAEEYAGTLSGGQRKLLELGRTLMAEPEMLLLDEPVAGVNPTLANHLMEVVHRIRADRDLTILLIEHDMETVMQNCERVVVMAEGKKLTDGTPEEIQQDPEVVDAYLGGG